MNSEQLIELLQQNGVRQVTPRGENIMACCPNHSERRPSWGISVHPPHVHGCFACGFRGTLFGLLLKFGYSVEKTRRLLQISKVGDYHLEAWKPRPVREDVAPFPDSVLSEQLLYMFSPVEGKARRYLLHRGLLPVAYKKAGLLYDRTQKRVVFPWYFKGTLRGVTGRAIEADNPMRVLPYFNTAKGKCLYLPLGDIYPGTLYLVEGEIDALKVFSVGQLNVAAVGFGSFTDEQADLVLKSSANAVVCFFDDDATGERLTKRVLDKLGGRKAVHAVCYSMIRQSYEFPEGVKLDPAGLLRRQLREALFMLRRNIDWPEL